jgi:hypothetical protein
VLLKLGLERAGDKTDESASIHPFDPYPEIISYEVPYKIVYFEGDRCTGFEYLGA